MYNNCLVTTLKGVVPNDNLPYLNRGVILYDSTNGDAEAGDNTYNKVLLRGLSEIFKIDSSVFSYSGTLSVKSDVTVPGDYTRKMFFSIKDLTGIQTNYGTSPTLHLSKYLFRMSDLAKCKKLETASFIGGKFLDVANPNIESLCTLTKCSYYNITGPTYGDWRGDVKTFTDGLLENGLDISVVPVIVIVATGGSSGTPILQLTINGSPVYTDFGRNIHIVFTSAGHYSIYKNINASAALDDYSGYTPAYSK